MPDVTNCAAVSTLTATYDYAEHHQPDCVIMASSLASCAEFELLENLLRIMGIGCVLVSNDGILPSFSAEAGQHVVCIRDDAAPNALLNAVKAASHRPAQSERATPPLRTDRAFDPEKIILIGASTGGIDALLKTIQGFGESCPPTLIVQHTGGSFATSLIRLLNSATHASVAAARDGCRLKPGHIYLPPGDAAHLCLRFGQTTQISLREGPQTSGHRPSVDVLFASAVPHAHRVAAALLTGMGRDGAQGLTDLRHAGAHTIAQDERSSVVYGMPRVAKEMGGVAQELSIEKIGPALLSACAAKVRV